MSLRHYVLIAAVGALVTFLVTPLVRHIALARGLVDRPGGRKVHETPIPRLGGVAIFAGVLAALAAQAVGEIYVGWGGTLVGGGTARVRILGVVLAMTVIFLVGLIDDLLTISPGFKLLGQVLAAVIAIASGLEIAYVGNPFGGGLLSLGLLAGPVSLVYIVGFTNVINLIDGLDGLAVGSGMLILSAVLLLNWNSWQGVQSLAVFSLLGALAGFLVYNFPPASIYMGDSGSLFLGFFLSSFALTALPNAPGARFIGITALAFIIPLLDMTYAILRRWYRGVPVYSSDRDHLHHKLLQKGLSKRRVVLLFYAANLVLMLGLVFLVRIGSKPWITFSILFVLSLAAFAVFQFLSALSLREFFGKIALLFRSFRRTRYHLYLINRFERRIEEIKKFDSIRVYLDELFRDYGLHVVEIHSCKGMVYVFGSRDKAEDAMSFEFPLVKNGVFFGRVMLQKRLSSDHLLCSGELADSLSKYLHELLADHSLG